MKSTTHALWRLIAFVALGFLLSASASAVHFDVTVNDAGDALHSPGCATTGGGTCTLRDAITFSNANPPTATEKNSILFNIPGSGVHSILLSSDLPSVANPTIIDGYSQPGATSNTLAVGDDATLLVELTQCEIPLDCSAGTALLTIDGGTGSVVQGLAIDVPFFGDFTLIPSVVPLRIKADSCKISGDFIGVDPTGTGLAIGGVEVDSANNVIGGTTPAERNVIAGLSFNTDGANILLNGDGNRTVGNYIGTNAAGLQSLSTADPCTPLSLPPCLVGSIGIKSPGSSNTIGGSTVAERNVVSGNIGGISLDGRSNLVTGNFVGLGADGTTALGNGVVPSTSPASGVSITGLDNTVGGTLFGTANVIAFNNPAGVAVGGNGVRNPILGNSIFGNDGLGIQLGTLSSPLPNDLGDSDSGPNELQNYPEILHATAKIKTTLLDGTLNSAPNRSYRIELFLNTTCDASGFGEGEQFLETISVTTDGSGNASFATSVPVGSAPVGSVITATATDPAGNTSEFSACLEVQPAPSPTRIRILRVEGPIRVAPGVPVEFPIRVEEKVLGALTGEAVVSDDAGDVCRTPVSPAGDGACSITFGSPGKFKVHAEYLGNGLYEGSTSPPVNVKVTAAGAP